MEAGVTPIALASSARDIPADFLALAMAFADAVNRRSETRSRRTDLGMA